jgi:hypothetical protein
MLEIYSLEYKWNGSIMESRAWHYCSRCHQIWIINDAQPHKSPEESKPEIKAAFIVATPDVTHPPLTEE